MKKNIRSMTPRRHGQRGAVLFIILMLIVAAAALATTLFGSSVVDERISRNQRDRNIALQAAEGALRDARQDLTTSKTFAASTRVFNGMTGATSTCNATGFKGFCTPLVSASSVRTALLDADKSVAFGEATGRAATDLFKTGAIQGAVTQQPRYLIEVIPDEDDPSLETPITKVVYRVSAIGFGTIQGSEVIVQEVVRTPSN